MGFMQRFGDCQEQEQTKQIDSWQTCENVRRASMSWRSAT
jgi:hypothetical protein